MKTYHFKSKCRCAGSCISLGNTLRLPSYSGPSFRRGVCQWFFWFYVLSTTLFNRVPGAPLGVPGSVFSLHPNSDAGYAVLLLNLLGAPVSIRAAHVPYRALPLSTRPSLRLCAALSPLILVSQGSVLTSRLNHQTLPCPALRRVFFTPVSLGPTGSGCSTA